MKRLHRPRPMVRTAALGSLVLALAVGCGGGGTADDDGDPAGGDETAEVGDGSGASDGGSGGSDEGSGASDGGGEDDASAGGAAPLAEDADLAAEALPVPAEDAVELGREAAGGGDLVSIEIDHDGGRGWVWELEFERDELEIDVDIDAADGTVLGTEEDTARVPDPVVDIAEPLPYADAIDLALEQADGRVEGWTLDEEDGRVQYTVEIELPDGDDVDVEIDVETREVRVDD